MWQSYSGKSPRKDEAFSDPNNGQDCSELVERCLSCDGCFFLCQVICKCLSKVTEYRARNCSFNSEWSCWLVTCTMKTMNDSPFNGQVWCLFKQDYVQCRHFSRRRSSWLRDREATNERAEHDVCNAHRKCRACTHPAPQNLCCPANHYHRFRGWGLLTKSGRNKTYMIFIQMSIDAKPLVSTFRSQHITRKYPNFVVLTVQAPNPHRNQNLPRHSWPRRIDIWYFALKWEERQFQKESDCIKLGAK